jgi:hypothetical protein
LLKGLDNIYDFILADPTPLFADPTPLFADPFFGLFFTSFYFNIEYH